MRLSLRCQADQAPNTSAPMTTTSGDRRVGFGACARADADLEFMLWAAGPIPASLMNRLLSIYFLAYAFFKCIGVTVQKSWT